MKANLIKLNREKAALIIVDVQEGFRPAVLDFDRTIRNVGTLAAAAKILGLPTVASEQYPKGLGRTVPEVAQYLEDLAAVEKVDFSAVAADGFVDALQDEKRSQVILCGIEAHVCVAQTAYDLIDCGFNVHVVSDAVSSRTAQNCELGIRKMELAGAVATSVETALFELLERAGTPEFKEIQGLIK